MSGFDPVERSGFDFDIWEDSLLTSCSPADLNALAGKLLRRADEVKRRRAWLLHLHDTGTPRYCYQCKHYGFTHTCGVEIEGLCQTKEEWAFTKTYGMRHVCHLGLTR